jgi:hypothetical protein
VNDFIPYVRGTSTTRRRNAAALALLAVSEPGTEVVVLEVPIDAYGTRTKTQSNLAGKATHLGRSAGARKIGAHMSAVVDSKSEIVRLIATIPSVSTPTPTPELVTPKRAHSGGRKRKTDTTQSWVRLFTFPESAVATVHTNTIKSPEHAARLRKALDGRRTLMRKDATERGVVFDKIFVRTSKSGKTISLFAVYRRV